MSDVLVDMIGISKRFTGIWANEQINFQVYQGEIHALLGENGAGKSTLMSILSGLYYPDQGEIHLRGKKVDLRSPRDALTHGVGMVHQHFRLVEPFTVTENVILGTDSGSRIFLNQKDYAGCVYRFSEEFGLKVDPGARIWQLSVGEKQRVEILKLLYRGADLLILDEPTAVLTPQEVNELFHTLRRMADSGKSVILITHKLQEVMDVADRITVLRNGRNVGTVLKRETSEMKLTRMMVDREVLFHPTTRSGHQSEVVLRLTGLKVMGDRDLPVLDSLSLEVHAGEIFGIAGIAGNGQRELAEAVIGLRPPVSGRIQVGDQDMTRCGPQQFIDAGVSSIPEDRLGAGLVPNLNIYDNMILKDYRKSPISHGWFLNFREIGILTRQLVSEFQIQVADLSYPVRLLSGGNLQKLLLARETHNQPKLMIASYPVRGLDVGATETVYRLLLDQCDRGTAVLLISEDLEELMYLSDRIAVIFRGEIMGTVPSNTAKIDELGLMMVGRKKTEVSGA